MSDPTFYKEPWVSDVKIFKRVKREATTFFGWYGLFSGVTEAICAPVNEHEYRERDRPAYVGTEGKK